MTNPTKVRRPGLRTLLLSAAGLAMVPMAPPALAQPALTQPALAKATHETLSVQADRTLARTTHLSSLTIAPGAKLSAPEGKSLTLTVDGVERNLAPGTYTGAVVLTVTPQMPFRFMDLPPEMFRAAVVIDDDHYVADKSVAAAVLGGKVGDTSANDLVIRSEGENFNGVWVGGHSNYTLNAPRITLIGNGGNDFSGFGAGITVTDDATLTLHDAQLDSWGAIRPAIFVNKQGKLKVFDSRITVRNGTLPDDYVFDFALGKMKKVPWQLGLSGNVRATVIVDSGEVYYKRSTIRSEGWGALSIDAPKHVRMLVEDCLIETSDSGYGVFSIGDSITTVRNSHFDVADMALIMAANGSAHITDGTTVDSKRFGVMMFTYPRAGTLLIDGKTVMNTASTGIQAKGTGGKIVIDDARIIPANGILIQAMIDDNDRQPGVPRAGYAYGNKTPADPDLEVSLRNTELTGDVVNSRTSQGNLFLTLENATLEGRVSNAEQSPRTGAKPNEANFRLIGDVANAFGPRKGTFGTYLTLDLGSTWIVTAPSYLDKLTILPGAKLVGKDGTPVTISVDGVQMNPAKPGSYVGAIVVAPA